MKLLERTRINLAKRLLYSDSKDGLSRVWQHLFINNSVPTSHFTDYESYLLAIKRISWVYSCVTVIGYSVAANPWELYKRGTDDVAEKHPYRTLLEAPNAYQTYMDYTEEGVQHMVLTGNWYEAHEGNNAKGQPMELYNLRPSRMTIVPSKEDLFAGYVHEVSGVKVPFEKDEILHYRFANPTDELYGLGVIEAGETTFNTEFHQQMSLLSFFANRAQPSGIMRVVGDIDQEDWELVKAGWRENHGGSRKRYGTAFLKGNLEYQQIGLDPGQIEQVEVGKETRNAILAMFGVPLGKLGLRETSEVKDDKEDRFFYKETINPLLVRIAAKRNHWLQQVGWGDIEWRPELRDFDDDAEYVEISKGMAATYSYTRNEIRAIRGEPPLKVGGNVIVMPLNMQEIEVEVEEPTTVSKGKKSLDTKANNRAKLVKTILKQKQDIEAQSLKLFTPKIQGLFKSQSKRVIEAGGKIKNKKDLTVERIFDKEAEDKELVKALRPLHAFVLDETVKSVKGLLGAGKSTKAKIKAEPKWAPLDEGWEFPNLDKFLGNLAVKVVRINDTTRDAIAGQLDKGFERGYSTYQMIHGVEAEDYKGVLGVFDEASEYRAERIVRTENMLVYNNATLETYKDLGLKKVEIADGLLPTSDDDCRARDGEVWTLEEAQAFEDHPSGTYTILPYFDN